MKFLIGLLCLVLAQPVSTVIGYDCGSEILNMSTISLLDIEECDYQKGRVDTSLIDIALLQVNEYEHVTIMQCKIEVSRTVHYCGMHSHISLVENGYMEYIHPISWEACQLAHYYGTFRISNTVIDGLQVNITAIRSITLAGRVTSDGTCAGTQYSDPYGTWSSVVVMEVVKINLKSSLTRVKVESNKIYLPSGSNSKLSEGYYIDSDGGYTFWDSIPRKYCKENMYSVLYKGPSTKLVSTIGTVFSVNVRDTSFSLAVTGPKKSCGLSILKTEHPRLFIIKSEDLVSLSEGNVIEMNPDNLDLFLYINAKFIYVERYIRNQIESRYVDVMLYRCKIKKDLLKNTLVIASTQPDEFAYRLMGGPDYMAVLAGEVVHIVQCIPVEEKIEHTRSCYNRAQVKRGNFSMFLMPRTHVLTHQASEIPCNSPMLHHYKLGTTWYKFMPMPTETVPPISLKPNAIGNWKYTNPSHLATSGIYTKDDLETMRNRIMFTIEQTSAIETVAQKFTNGSRAHPSIMNVLIEEILEKLAESAWDRTWGKFVMLGTYSAGFIGIFMCLRLIKLVADIIVHGYALHTVYGWSIHLLGAVWDSLTHLLLYLAKDHKQLKIPPNNKKIKESSPDLEKGQPQSAPEIYPSLSTARHSNNILCKNVSQLEKKKTVDSHIYRSDIK